eukprot:m.483547 g.483547  ORF g.483547 m.483547 type:complete len:141 (-) comp22976_c0_seq1:99-521(-)
MSLENLARLREETVHRLQAEARTVQDDMAELNKLRKSREQLQTQYSENQLVKQELEILEEDDSVFKLIGPVMVKQDVTEAQSNVQSRLDWLGKEIERQEKQLETQTEKVNKGEQTVGKLQQMAQQITAQLQQAQASGQSS